MSCGRCQNSMLSLLAGMFSPFTQGRYNSSSFNIQPNSSAQQDFQNGLLAGLQLVRSLMSGGLNQNYKSSFCNNIGTRIPNPTGQNPTSLEAYVLVLQGSNTTSC